MVDGIPKAVQTVVVHLHLLGAVPKVDVPPTALGVQVSLFAQVTETVGRI